MKSLRSVSLDSSHRSCVPEVVKVVWQLYLAMYKSHPDGTGFEGMQGSWRETEAWHCKRSGKAIRENEASITVEVLGLKGSGIKAEAWHHEESPREIPGKGAVQLQQKTQAFWRCQYHGIIPPKHQELWSGACWSVEDKLLQRAEREK